MHDLSARLRKILKESRASASTAQSSVSTSRDPIDHRAVGQRLGGTVVETDRGPCVVIDRLHPPTTAYGCNQIEDFSITDRSSLRLLTADEMDTSSEGDAGSVVFFDLETTGLGGGAGSLAFLVGCGWFEPQGFRTRQFFLASATYEPALLEVAHRCLTAGERIISFNGKSFDAPMMENRWSFHRMGASLRAIHHLDMLHPARRLWRGSSRTGFRPPCTLGTLERALLGVTRVGDPGGYEIPSIYFEYVRTGRLDRLEPVLEHNRLDLLSLAGLTSRALRLVRDGPDVAETARECVGLGRLYERAGRRDLALRCFAVAAGVEAVLQPGSGPPEPMSHTGSFRDRDAATEALRWLARGLRRERRHAEAAEIWQRLAESDTSHRSARLEAIEALAVHHEHRTRELSVARNLARRALAGDTGPRLQRLLAHRLVRLDRKLGQNRDSPGPGRPLPLGE